MAAISHRVASRSKSARPIAIENRPGTLNRPGIVYLPANPDYRELGG
jgi:hypothetical protein